MNTIVFLELMGALNDLMNFSIIQNTTNRNITDISLNLKKTPIIKTFSEIQTPIEKTISNIEMIKIYLNELDTLELSDTELILKITIGDKKEIKSPTKIIKACMRDLNIEELYPISINSDTIFIGDDTILDVKTLSLKLFSVASPTKLRDVMDSIESILIFMQRKKLYRACNYTLDICKEFNKLKNQYMKLIKCQTLSDYFKCYEKIFGERIYFEFDSLLPQNFLDKMEIANPFDDHIDPVSLEKLTTKDDKNLIRMILPIGSGEMGGNRYLQKYIKIESLIDLINYAPVTDSQILLHEPTTRTYTFTTQQIYHVINRSKTMNSRIYYDRDIHKYIYESLMKKDILFFQTLYNTGSSYSHFYSAIVQDIKKFIYDFWFNNDKSLEYIIYNEYEIMDYIRKSLIKLIDKLIDDQIHQLEKNEDTLADIFLYGIYKLALRNGAYEAVNRFQKYFPEITSS